LLQTGVEPGGTTTVVFFGGGLELKLRHPPRPRGIRQTNSSFFMITAPFTMRPFSSGDWPGTPEQ
jgi:hypothetical protein